MSSQGGEDRILERLFAQIGTTNRYAVEFGARDGVRGSNTHVLRQQGWTALLLDSHPRSPDVRKVKLTAENINRVFTDCGVPPIFDLLSIDVDGNDFHLWKALTACRARVVVIEYNCAFGPEESVVIPYRADRRWDRRSTYYGASACALVKLGRAKHYRLVDFVRQTNLFFVADEAWTVPMSELAIPPRDPLGYRYAKRLWETY